MESELSVRDVLTKEYVGVSESDSVRSAVKLMRDERAGCVLVVRGSDPVGIMTEWDVLGLVASGSDPDETTVGDVMSSPVVTIDPDLSMAEAATKMATEMIRNLVVTDANGTVGILTQRDVIAAAGSFQSATATSSTTNAGTTLEHTQETEPERIANGGDEFSTQGICEACGSLATSLREMNGQLLCTDCRSV